jgi:ABC-type uncharacterized transport system ATPase subunit
MDALAVEELRKRYGEVHALDGVSFRVHAGQVFGLLGPNGAGKSTTVKVLATLTKPDSGRAEVEGHATMLAIANFIGLPLFFLSSTLISIRQIPHWLQLAARFNPVDWGVIAARQVVLPGTDWNTVVVHLALLLGLSVATIAFATWTFGSTSARSSPAARR